MEIVEAKTTAKAIYLQAASLAGLEVGPFSPEDFAKIIADGFSRVSEKRRPEAVANLLHLLAEIIKSAQVRGDKMLHEDNVKAGQDEVCPIYPFGKPAVQTTNKAIQQGTRKKLGKGK